MCALNDKVDSCWQTAVSLELSRVCYHLLPLLKNTVVTSYYETLDSKFLHVCNLFLELLSSLTLSRNRFHLLGHLWSVPLATTACSSDTSQAWSLRKLPCDLCNTSWRNPTLHWGKKKKNHDSLFSPLSPSPSTTAIYPHRLAPSP